SVKPVNLIPLEVDVLLLHIFYPSLLSDSNAKMHSHCLIWHNGYVKCPCGLFSPHHLFSGEPKYKLIGRLQPMNSFSCK
ncbi:MAG: hypothetical protein RMK18_12535, partial [Armatimonadota bacterium]|nr:hypothetical protein [Armatimonadota bacterium]